MEENKLLSEPVLLFDGVCNLCNSSVQFIFKNEKNEKLKFAAIQSEAGQALLTHFNIDPMKTDSVILIKDGRVYIESDAILTVSQFLKSPWNLGRIFLVIPRSIRNLFYKKIAKNRYKWFGKKESCMLPTSERKKRFLE